jgi:hypothetical protein
LRWKTLPSPLAFLLGCLAMTFLLFVRISRRKPIKGAGGVW